jgi:hypothetical protein
MDRKCVLLFLACCVVCIATSGCRSHPEKQIPAEPVVESQFVATGPKISAECLVTIFDGQVGKYVSEQRHQIFPTSSAIIIQATEPEGEYEWTLSNGVFKTVKGDSSKLPATVCTHEIAQAIVLSVSARGGFLNDKAGLVLDSISIAGQMYQPVVIYARDTDPVIQKVYREVSSFLIDWVEVNNSQNNIMVAARSYNVRNLSGSDKLMPATIDIYNTDSSGRPADRIMKIEYKSFELGI